MILKFFCLVSLLFIGCVPPSDIEDSNLSQEEIEARNKEM